MTHYGAKQIAESFRTVRKNTLTIAEEIGEEHYGFSPAEGTRTVAQLLTHIAVTPRLALEIHKVYQRQSLDGFEFFGFFGKLMAEEQTPRSKEQIIALLREEGENYAGWAETLTEDFLAQEVTFPAGAVPPSRARFEMLLGVKEHEMHHRGQLMLIERMIGLVPHMTRAMMERVAQLQAAAQASA